MDRIANANANANANNAVVERKKRTWGDVQKDGGGGNERDGNGHKVKRNDKFDDGARVGPVHRLKNPIFHFDNCLASWGMFESHLASLYKARFRFSVKTCQNLAHLDVTAFAKDRMGVNDVREREILL
jgi:hypothetical protein